MRLLYTAHLLADRPTQRKLVTPVGPVAPRREDAPLAPKMPLRSLEDPWTSLEKLVGRLGDRQGSQRESLGEPSPPRGQRDGDGGRGLLVWWCGATAFASTGTPLNLIEFRV